MRELLRLSWQVAPSAKRRRRFSCWLAWGATLCLSAVAVLGSTSAFAGPLQHPKRLVSVYTVDLDPLFKWWSKHQGPRPLSSWVHITGSIVGTNSAGWIVEGQVERSARDREQEETSPNSARQTQKIVLKSPPIEDLTEFEELSSKLSALNFQRASLARQESETRMREQAVGEQERAARRNGSRARVLALEDRHLKQAEHDVQAQAKPLDQQIQELKAKLASYPGNDHYTIDCFALDLQNDYDHLPVYDHGQVVK